MLMDDGTPWLQHPSSNGLEINLTVWLMVSGGQLLRFSDTKHPADPWQGERFHRQAYRGSVARLHAPDRERQNWLNDFRQEYTCAFLLKLCR